MEVGFVDKHIFIFGHFFAKKFAFLITHVLVCSQCGCVETILQSLALWLLHIYDDSIGISIRESSI